MRRLSGFTLIELVMTMVIVGVLAVVALPRLFDNNVFQSRGYLDQVKATLRYAQKVAIAQHRFVCAVFTVNSVTLSLGATNTCGTALALPDGKAVLTAPAGVGFGATPANFNFDVLGKPSFAAAQSITITGAPTALTIEAESGYVH